MEPKVLFQCGRCHENYEDRLDALACCAPEVTELFLCPVCQAEHACWYEANRCCVHPEGVLIALEVSAFELEWAGQERLPAF